MVLQVVSGIQEKISLPEFKCDLILSEDEARYASSIFMDYYQSFGNMSDWMRQIKLERVAEMPTPLFGFNLSDDFFSDFTMSPNDMNFEVKVADHEMWVNYLEITTSAAVESSVPGRKLILTIYETTTNKIAGFIRLGSPMMNIAPRNRYFGEVVSADQMPIFNKHSIMGMTIVPVQPFGYNYLGGKLLAALCCSHASRRMLDEKYDTEFCLFETTSLYGNIKGASMYDGMRPFLRYKGDTQSKFLLTLGEEIYFEMRDWFTERNGGEDLIHASASSRKLKMQTKMVGIIKASLKEHDTKAYELFSKEIARAGDVTTQKRFYMGEYGYANAKDVLLGKTDKLIKAENYDRFELENVIAWWKKNATKRYNKMIAEGKVRTELEVWNQHTMNKIDIIR